MKKRLNTIFIFACLSIFYLIQGKAQTKIHCYEYGDLNRPVLVARKDSMQVQCDSNELGNQTLPSTDQNYPAFSKVVVANNTATNTFPFLL